MSEVRPNELDFLKPNQYSIRGMLIATAVMAGLLAVVGPTLRERSVGTVVLAVAAFLLGVLLWWVVMTLDVAQVRGGQAICGRVLLVVERRVRRQAVAERFYSYSFLIVLGAGFFLILVREDSYLGRGLVSVGLAVVIAVLLSIATNERHRYCVICEHGFFCGPSFYRWTEVQKDRWTEKSLGTGGWLELRGHDRLLMEFPVYEKHVDAIEKALVQARPRYHEDEPSS